ncbi:nickel transporter [Streptomyces shenzhenensis]|uniref:nickel transporter n=1 Tax=Streptomyces shenzhenensis TaxID=943815 RepID=UPI003D8DADA6
MARWHERSARCGNREEASREQQAIPRRCSPRSHTGRAARRVGAGQRQWDRRQRQLHRAGGLRGPGHRSGGARAARSAAPVRLPSDPGLDAAARSHRPARADQAHADGRPPDGRQRVPRRGHQREPGERAAGVRRLRLHRRRAADARRARPVGDRRHRSRAGALAAADRDDPAGRGGRRRGHRHRWADRPRQPGRRPDPRLPRRRTRREGAAHPRTALARRRLALPLPGVAARRHPALRAQAPGARAGAVVQGRQEGTGRPDDRARARRRPARRRRDDLHRPAAVRQPGRREGHRGQAARAGDRAARRGARLRPHRPAAAACDRAGGAARAARRGAGVRRGAVRRARRAGEGPLRGAVRPARAAAHPARRLPARPLDELRRELAALAADDAGQLWPEANQVLHHLSAGYARITQLIDNVLGYQRLDTGADDITRTKVMLDAVVAAGVDGAVELIGPGRVQFAVHAPPIEAEVDPQRLATALAHLVADVAGVDATGNSPVSAGGYLDNTVVVAAAQRGEVVRIEVRGPYAGGDPVHQPIVRGIVRAHGGVLQTHEVPGMSGSAYVLEVPIGGGAGAVPAPALPALASDMPAPAEQTSGGGRRRARRSSVDAFLESEVPGESGAGPEAPAPTGRRRRRAAEEAAPVPAEGAEASSGTGRRRGRPAENAGDGDQGVAEGAVMTAAEHAAGTAASGTGLGGTVPPAGVPAPAGRLAPGDGGEQQQAALPPALPPAGSQNAPAAGPAPVGPGAAGSGAGGSEGGQPTGRRRRALAAAAERNAAQEAGARTVFALPPAEADRSPEPGAGNGGGSGGGTGQAPGQVPAQVPVQVPAVAQAQGVVPAQGQMPVPAQGQMAVPAQGQMPVPAQGQPVPAQGQVPAPPQGQMPVPAQGQGSVPAQGQMAVPAQGQMPIPAQGQMPVPAQGQPVPAQGQVPAAPGQVRVPGQMPVAGQAQVAGVGGPGDNGRHDAVPHDQGEDHTPPQPHPTSAPTGRRRRAVAQPGEGPAAPGTPAQGVPVQAEGMAQPGVAAQAAPGPQALPGAPVQGVQPAPGQGVPAQPVPQSAAPGQHPLPGQPVQPGLPAAQPLPAETPPAALPAAEATPAQPVPGADTPAPGTQLPPGQSGAQARTAQPLPAEAADAPVDPNSTQGRAISVRTLGQGVPFSRQAAQVQHPTATPPPHGPNAAGRRRKLGTPPDPAARTEQRTEQGARPHPPAEQPPAHPSLAGQSRLAPGTEGAGRSYAIGAPDENAAEGPEPLDGPGGAIEVADPPHPQPMDDELPPEPLDNPRRLLVWPAPDVTTQQALSDRGYRPVIVHSREEVDAQIAAFPAALFVDPLTGPITRTALQSLRQAAVAAEVPVLVTAGLGQATREAAYGADPAVLLKALAPRDSEQHPPRVLLIEEHAEIALALTSTLERRGMQVARAASDADAVTLAGQLRPNLVVMDLLQVHRRQSGIIDWLRANGQLNRTPLVVYTAAVDQADLPRLASGEAVLFLAERSTSAEVQARIVDLLARIGTN